MDPNGNDNCSINQINYELKGNVNMENNISSSMNNSTNRKENSRVVWGRQIEFTLSCIGYAVGLGNLWRFPYLCMRNGGGAFLIPYFLFLFLCGLPLFYMELILGQFSSLSPLSMWKLCPLFKGIGWGMFIVSGIVSVYYNVIITWVLYYLGMSMRAEVPWKTCNNDWNTENCTARARVANMSLDHHNLSSNNVTLGTVSPAEEFWSYKALNISDGIENLGGIKWDLMLCLIAAWILVYLCLIKGIKSSGKVVYVTATVPYLFLTILLIRGVTLPGSLDGIRFYIIPKWAKLLEFKVWTEACLQIFYSLGPAWGGLITMSSYNKFHNNCLKDAVVVCLACSGTSFYAGFAIFSIIGFMAFDAGLPVDKVITQGPGLAFVAYPEAIGRLPISPFWAICFFLMLLTLGLDSQFGMLETVTSGCVDEFPDFLRKRKVVLNMCACVILLILGLPLVTRGGLYVFQIVDWYSASFSVMVLAFSECFVVCYIYGIGRFYHDISIMTNHRPSYIWAALWCCVTPALLLTMLIVSAVGMTSPTYGDYIYPWWAVLIGWILAMLSVIPLPIVALYKIYTTDGATLFQRLNVLLRPSLDWGPAKEPYRTYYKYTVSDANECSWIHRMRFTDYHVINNINNVENQFVTEKQALKSTESDL